MANGQWPSLGSASPGKKGYFNLFGCFDVARDAFIEISPRRIGTVLPIIGLIALTAGTHILSDRIGGMQLLAVFVFGVLAELSLNSGKHGGPCEPVRMPITVTNEFARA